MKKLNKLSLKEAKYDTQFPDQLTELQIKQTSKGTLVCQEMYIKELLKRLNILEVKTMLKKGNVIMKFCKMEDQVADIFTKTLSKDQFVKTGQLMSEQRYKPGSSSEKLLKKFHITDAKTIDTPWDQLEAG
ncbi:hypothetical protein KY289_030047 [Solanum tuberosum]|nr:hypothetical protein KY289_030047 [Solanum tuberosum]